MRSLIESDLVWLANEGGSPWTVIEVDKHTATIAQPGVTRIEPQSALKLVSDAAAAPSLPICPRLLPAMLAFAQAYPKRIEALDLADIHKAELQQKLAESKPLPKPNRAYPNGATVTVQRKDGLVTGVVRCFDPRDNSYTVEVATFDRLLCCSADLVSVAMDAAV